MSEKLRERLINQLTYSYAPDIRDQYLQAPDYSCYPGTSRITVPVVAEFKAVYDDKADNILIKVSIEVKEGEEDSEHLSGHYIAATRPFSEQETLEIIGLACDSLKEDLIRNVFRRINERRKAKIRKAKQKMVEDEILSNIRKSDEREYISRKFREDN